LVKQNEAGDSNNNLFVKLICDNTAKFEERNLFLINKKEENE
jgi:hypothetical protein